MRARALTVLTVVASACAAEPLTEAVAITAPLEAATDRYERLAELQLDTQALGFSSASSKLDNKDYSYYLESNGHEHFYNINYTRYPEGSVASYTGNEDNSQLIAAMRQTGEPLYVPSSRDRVARSDANVAPGTATTLAELDGPGQIVELSFDVPGFQNAAVRDDGRATKTASHFRVRIDPRNAGVRLVRRLDYFVGDQRARVRVDGAEAGVWSTPGRSQTDRFRDEAFALPSSLTANKSEVQIDIEFLGSTIDWNEFRYWVYSNVDGRETQSDELDVGNADSERAHAYTIDAQTWSGELTTDYPPDPLLLAAMSGTRLELTWDNAQAPAVSAPLLAFFGGGGERAGNMQSMAVGRRGEHFYCYFPMPFASHASARLVNTGTNALPLRQVKLVSRALRGDSSLLGRFHALYSARNTEIDRDFDILSVTGSGHYVGVSMLLPERAGTLEGNERIYVDGARSPAIAGTGTEDFFNGAWYFQPDSFATATHGAQLGATDTEPLTAYRISLDDRVPFRSGLRVAIQHGPFNNNTPPYASVAYYYLGGSPRLHPSDHLAIGDATSESSHSYQAPDAQQTSASSRYLSDDLTSYTFQGRTLAVDSHFFMRLPAANEGAVLRVTSLASATTQRADVFVEGEKIGQLRVFGTNEPALAWREQDLLLPRRLTQGKQDLEIGIVKVSGDWTDFDYQLLARD